jgi:pilus assembly protein FimV
VSRTEVARDAKGKPLQGRIAALEEDLVARDRALKEAGSRIAELEKNLNDLKKLAELKSKGGADLQAAAQAAKPAAAQPKRKKPERSCGRVAEAGRSRQTCGAGRSPLKRQSPPMPRSRPTRPSRPMPRPSPPKATSRPHPRRSLHRPATTAGTRFHGRERSAGLWWWRNSGAAVRLAGNLRLPQEEGGQLRGRCPLGEADLSAHSVFSTRPWRHRRASRKPASSVPPAWAWWRLRTPWIPVVEADTFLAFGRDAQAEEILLDALNVDPQPQAYADPHEAAGDLFRAQGCRRKFESVARELQG